MTFFLKPGFHIVVSVVRKKFIGQIQLYGNLPYKCSIQKERQIQLVVRDRMNSICPMNFFRTTDTTMWKPGLNIKGGMGSNVQGVSRSHALSKSNLLVAICLACPTHPPLLCFPA